MCSSPNPSIPESLELLLVLIFFLVFLGEFFSEEHPSKKMQFTGKFAARQKLGKDGRVHVVLSSLGEVAADTSAPHPSVKTA